ncbi:hypothetical protein WJX79_006558, partial [Trebouxia sp. C0005]
MRQTDAASSKRGISGVGDNQPGSASKRARGESAVSKLINTFDSPRSEPLSPSLGSRGSGTAAARTYFTSPHDQQGGFTLGTSPSQGRAPTSSAFSATTSFRGPHSESLGAYTSQETPARPDSDLASFEPGNAYSAQESAISPVAQDNQAGFGDDAFAQFSPFGHKAKQQTSPFGQQAEVLPGTQAGFDGQEVPLKASDQRAPSGQPASGGLPVTEDAPQGIKVVPPPPPTVGSSFGRSSSGLPLSPTQANQGALQRLPSDAFGEFPNPSQSRPPIADPHSQPGATPRQQAQTDVFMESPQLASTEVRSVSHPPATSGATSQMPTGTVPVPPPVGPPTGQGEGTDSLFVGKTAFDSAVKSAPEPTAEQGIARESAFSKANTAGTGPHFGSSSPKVSTAPRSQPLASWTSFEDPGPLPPMPAPTPDADPSDQDFCAPLPSAIAAQPSTTTAGVTSHTAKAAATPSAEPAPAPAQQVSKQRSNDPWATPVEPPAEVKAAENELLSATLAGLGGDAWGGNSFGPEMGKPLKEAGVSQDPAAAAVKAPPEPAAAKSQAESLTTQPSWMHLANSSNPFSSFIPMDNSASEPNPWATTAPQAAPEQQTFPPQPMGQAMGSSAHQQQAQQPAAFATWDSFDTAAPVAYPAIDDSRHPDVPSRTAATSRCPRSRAVRPGLPNMATSESATGVAATMKADKANRESLAKKKSAVKADLERVTAELEEVEQMKADAEDLEDEELLAEMLSEEQRLQALKHQYTAELASIQEASQAAAQALRQRLRRITGDRALGASGKSTSSESSQPATPVSAYPTSPTSG